MFLMIDNYDSFVYNLVRYIQELNEEIVVRRNDRITIEEIEAMNPEGIILSPGPKRPEDAGISEAILAHFKDKKPILGICLGHQVIGHVFGGRICCGEAPVHGQVHKIHHREEGLFAGLPTPFNGTRYHSLIVDRAGLPDCLEITAETGDGVIMGLRHRTYPIFGVQFHPEAELTEYGHELLRNFIEQVKALEVAGT